MVVNKPPNQVVHPGHGNYSGTLLNGLIYHNQNLPENSDGRPGLVHRIDKDTSGLLVVAKSDLALTKLAEQFFHKKIERKYLAIVWGVPKPSKDTIDKNLSRDKKNRMIMSVPDEDNIGKRAVTHYKVVQDYGYVSLIECQLETGRTHQIRAHMKHIGHPIFNDNRYGGDKILKGTIFNKYKQFVDNCFKALPRQALHAKTLGFVHPIKNKKMVFEIDVPDDFNSCLEKWKKYSKNN
jgi:23S rRNA pseudouridine1911/1915/1917 synthase